jgi:hypothetical protein
MNEALLQSNALAVRNAEYPLQILFRLFADSPRSLPKESLRRLSFPRNRAAVQMANPAQAGLRSDCQPLHGGVSKCQGTRQDLLILRDFALK